MGAQHPPLHSPTVSSIARVTGSISRLSTLQSDGITYIPITKRQQGIIYTINAI